MNIFERLISLGEICRELSREIELRQEVIRFHKFFSEQTLESYYNNRTNPKFRNYNLTQLETAHRLATADYIREIDRLIASAGPETLSKQTQEH